MMNTLDGVWRLISITSSGGMPVGTGQTHLVLRSGSAREVWPGRIEYVDAPREEISITIDGSTVRRVAQLRRPDGAVTRRYEESGAFELDGDALVLHIGPYDDDRSIERYVRERDSATLAALEPAPAPQKRPSREHAFFGTLMFDANLEWWTATLRIGAAPVRVSVFALPDADDAPFDRAATIVREIVPAEVIAHAARGLLELKNEGWLDEDETTHDEATLAARFALESITVSDGGAAELWLTDGDAFGGHGILVSREPSGALGEPEIHG